MFEEQSFSVNLACLARSLTSSFIIRATFIASGNCFSFVYIWYAVCMTLLSSSSGRYGQQEVRYKHVLPKFLASICWTSHSSFSVSSSRSTASGSAEHSHHSDNNSKPICICSAASLSYAGSGEGMS